MSVPDHLVVPYFRALSEWQDQELRIVVDHLEDGSLHPVDLKRAMAGEVTAALHGVDAAMKAREDFAAQFSRSSYADIGDLATVLDPSQPVVEVVKVLGFAASNGEVRRLAEQHGIRLVLEPAGGGPQEQAVLGPEDIRQALTVVLAGRFDTKAGASYLKVGRKLARIA
jgi:tyrosyl-tRNA synthetase